MDNFTFEIDRFVNKAHNNIGLIIGRIAMAVFRRVIMMTPVKTGRARGNWQTTRGVPATGTIDAVDKSGSATVRKMISVVRAATDRSKDVHLFLTNNLPYIKKLEDGSSKQAASGMVKVTLTEYPGIVAKNARLQSDSYFGV